MDIITYPFAVYGVLLGLGNGRFYTHTSALLRRCNGNDMIVRIAAKQPRRKLVYIIYKNPFLSVLNRNKIKSNKTYAKSMKHNLHEYTREKRLWTIKTSLLFVHNKGRLKKSDKNTQFFVWYIFALFLQQKRGRNKSDSSTWCFMLFIFYLLLVV